jgi:uncharacterized phage protein (TIGR01671 family)
MREIKFRAWNNKEKKLWPADLIKRNSIFALSSSLPVKDFLVLPTSEHITLEQYTGLKDKNGKEIFERDHLKCNHFIDAYGKTHHLTHAVYWNKDQFCWKVKDKSGEVDIALWVYVKNAEDIEVIGNTHENPELLEN